MKNKALMFVVCLLLLSIPFIADMFCFVSIIKGDYKTPWYSEKWYKQPYFHLSLMGYDSKTYWTTNAIKSERWLVKETIIGDKEFWTVIERIDI